ncbi:MAG: response regulator transcription factor [Chloroflexota bacterium]
MQSHLDAGIQPDVILMDIQMPGMSGLEATRLVALKYPNIKIVALTGALTGIENHSMKASMLQAGAVDYVTKTEAASQLVHVIRDVAQEDQDVLLDTASQSTGMHSMAHAMVVNSNGKAQNDPVQYGHSESVQSTYHRGPAGDVDVYSTNGNSADGYKYVMRQDVFGTVGLHRPFEDKLESMTTKQEEPCKLTRRELDVMKTLMKGYTNKEIARSLIISERTVQTHLRNIFSKMEVNSRTEAILVAMRDGWVPVAV